MAGILYAANPTSFAPIQGDAPVGVAAAPGLLLVTEYSSGNVDSIDSSGKVSLFATIPGAVGTGLERYVAIAPSQSTNAGFIPRDIFVTQGPDIYKISGGVVSHFATILGAPADHTGITFDHVGTFGYNMIVTTSDPDNFTNGGKVYKVDGGGNPTLIADLSGTTQTLEGPAVAPASFGTYQGQILVADESYQGFGAVHAIDISGTPTYDVPDFRWYGAEGVVVIPSNPCAFSAAGGSFFQAIEDLGSVYQYPTTDFTGLGGSILVTSEFGAGTALVSWNGSEYKQTSFDTSITGIDEGSAWADCDVPTPTPTPTTTATTTPVPTAAPTNLTVSAATGTYGGTSSTFTATLTRTSDNSPVVGETINFTLNNISAGSGITDANGVATSGTVALTAGPFNGGFYPTGAAASFGGDSSFSASTGSNSLTVSPAILTVSADGKSRPYGFLNPPFTASYTGFVNNETLATSGVSGQPNFTTIASQYSAVGNYTISITQGTLNPGNNYTFAFKDGTLTVSLCGGAIIGINSITIGASSALVDSYNSSIGYPASQGNQATLLSNGTITLQGAKLHGDLVSSTSNVALQSGSLVTGDVVYSTTLSNSATVQGAIDHQSSTPFVLPIPSACGTFTAAPATGNVWITGAYTYNAAKGDLTVSGGGTATLANGSYCFHNVTVSGSSTLRVNGAVMISVTGQFNTTGGSIQNTTNIPTNLQVTSSYTGNNGVTVSGGSAAFLSIYAPGTSVQVTGGGPLFGSVVGKTLTVSGNSSIHEDLGLPCWP